MNAFFKKYLGALGLVACSLIAADNSIINSNTNNHLNELFFIDTSIENYYDLIFDIRSSQNKDIRIVAINPSDIPLSKISNEIKKYQNLAEIHFVSHGEAGKLLVGNHSIDQNTISQNAHQVSSWADSLKEDGKILLYGCNVSKGVKGKRFINKLADLTGADVYASNNKSGMKKIGQDWILEDSTNGLQYASLITNNGNTKFTKSLDLFSSSAFLYADNIIAGIGPDGAFGSRVAAPDSLDITTDRFIGSTIGYVSDPTRNNFSGTYDGDFFVPVIPEEGWAIRVNGSTYNNNRSFQTKVDIPGSLSNFQKKERFSSVDWKGEIESLRITQIFRTYDKGLGIIIDVTLENTSAVDMNDVYYLRTVDPDNNAFNVPNPTGSSITKNTIVHQGGNGFGAAVSATQNRSGQIGDSIVTLSGYSEKSRVSFSSIDVDSGGIVRDPVKVYNGTGDQLVAGSQTIDSPISLALKFEKIKPGEEIRFRWSYALADIDFPEIKLDDDGSSGLGNGSFKQVYLLGTEGLPITDGDITIVGSTADELEGLFVKITNPSIGDHIQIQGSIPAGISIDTDETNDDFELSFKGSATKEKYIELIKAVRFDNQNIGANLATREVIVQVLDKEFNLSNSIDAQVFITVPLLINQTISGDNQLNNEEVASDLPINGTTAPNAELTLTLTDINSNEVIKTTTLDDDENWEIKLNPAEIATFDDGLIEVAGSSEDVFGNITTGSAEFTKDTEMILVIDNPVNQSIITANEYVIDGETDPDSTVVVTLPNGKEFTTTADSQGKWSVTIDEVDGEFNKTFEVVIKATDPAKNTKTETLTLKTPPHPVAFTDLDVDASGVAHSTKPTISGTSLAGTSITVTITTNKGEKSCSTTTDNNGRWSCKTPTLESGGVYPVHVESTANNGAVATANETITIPNLSLNITEPVSNALISPNNPLVIGDSDPGASIIVSTRGGITCTDTAASTGKWSCNLSTLEKGEDYIITATAKDDADNEATDSTNVTISNLLLTIISPTFNELVEDDTPVITGKTDPNVEITVTTEFGKICKTVADTNGNWSCQLDRIPVGGPYDLSILAEDKVNNIKSTVPWRLSIPDVPLEVSEPQEGDTVTSNPLTIMGTTNANADVTVKGINGQECTATADINGAWSCDLFGLNADVNQSIVVTSVKDGKEKELIRKVNVVIPLIISEPREGETITSSEPTVKGTTDPNSDITVKGANGEECTTKSNDLGEWECQLEGLLSGNNQVITITSVNQNGNIKEAIRTISVAIDDGRVETILKGGGVFNPALLLFYFLIFLRKRIVSYNLLKK